MTAVATAWAVEGADGKQFRVSRESASRVKITWLCGDVVEFSPSTLEEAVRNLRLVASHDVWLRVKPDYAGDSFVVTIKDGQLYAQRNPSDMVEEYEPHVTWAEVEELIAPAPVKAEQPIIEPAVYSGRRGGVRGWFRERFNA